MWRGYGGRGRPAALALVAALCWLGAAVPASAHAGLASSFPLAGSALDRPPATVRLSFSEAPEASLSTVAVRDPAGEHQETGRPQAVAGDPLSLAVPVGDLTPQVYTVTYRVLSRVDGHAVSGRFDFGVGVLPASRLDAIPAAAPGASPLEVVARWALLAGLAAVAGTALAGLAATGRGAGRLAAAGWAMAAAGLVLLAVAQRAGAHASFAALWPTAVGRALAGRGLALAAAGAALLAARRWGRPALAAAAAATGVALAVHVGAGHAAAARTWRAAVVAGQWVHVATAAAWLGGLGALLLAVRGAPSPEKAARVRRFSALAVVALPAVVATGAVAGAREVGSWSELAGTGYGRTVLAKAALAAVVLALAARNRLRNAPLAASDLGPLRRTGGAEVGAALAALAAAALLAASSPPAATRGAPRGWRVAGHDRAATLTARLTTPVATAGPNRFTVRLEDHHRGRPVPPTGVGLRFTPVDDAGVAPTMLALRPTGKAWEAVGDGVAFDGRWRIDVVVERPTTSAAVPLLVSTEEAPQFVSVLREPGRPAVYSVQIADETVVRFSPSADGAGRRSLEVEWFDIIGSERPVAPMVLTLAHSGHTTREAVRRVGPGRFTAAVRLAPGTTTVTAITRSEEGERLRAVLRLRSG
ncbi:MAG TPA: copper resistance CopC family protein [Acidimicrobiales bacterium]|nr:copper resistance CopC family protein [Acidimicrobiales bacterium]